ncbi:MAG: spermidine/putrescine transport system substrate-binding protein [Chloroflexota bacterium]|jgi:spermidine/putrescine-binding protein|nr:spermidine/putrescine transport system substrate-binding protein [Chloroflexota bacterium]
MADLIRDLSRRQFLKGAAAAGAAVGLGGIAAACATPAAPSASAAAGAGASAAASVAAASAAPGPTGTFNWMTWVDHYYPEELAAIAASKGISVNLTELADNADGFTKLKEVGGQLDMISGDALWVPHYFEAGLIEAFDINSLEVAKQLYSIAREFKIWTKPEGYLGYPFGWSPVQIYYDPAHVSPAPDSWEVLLDPKYTKKVVVENQPVEVMAYMGKAAGVVDPYNMTPDEIAKAKDLATKLKPNLLKFSQQNTDTIAALISGEAWIATGNLGTETRVKQAGGPDLNVFTPKEGTIGWMDSEMTVKGGANTQLIRPYLETANVAEYIAANFMINQRPLFNEAAYKLLVNQGQKDLADRFLYNKPETVLTMTLKGPGTSTQGAINAFNEVFGA